MTCVIAVLCVLWAVAARAAPLPPPPPVWHPQPHHVGLRYAADTEMNFHPVSGDTATQTERWLRMQYQAFTMVPMAYRFARGQRTCSATLKTVRNGFAGLWGEFFVENSVLKLDQEGVYDLRAPEYDWTVAMGLIERLADCTQKAKVPLPDALAALYQETGATPHVRKLNKLLALVGLLTTKVARPPLTSAQVALLHEIHELHQSIGFAIQRDMLPASELDLVARRLAELRHALEATARDGYERTLLTLPEHPTTIDPWLPRAERDRLFDAADMAHAAWMEAVLARDQRRAWRAGLAHLRVHIRLAWHEPTMRLRTICDGDVRGCSDSSD